MAVVFRERLYMYLFHVTSIYKNAYGNMQEAMQFKIRLEDLMLVTLMLVPLT